MCVPEEQCIMHGYPSPPLLSICKHWTHRAQASQSAIPASPFLDHLLANT